MSDGCSYVDDGDDNGNVVDGGGGSGCKYKTSSYGDFAWMVRVALMIMEMMVMMIMMIIPMLVIVMIVLPVMAFVVLTFGIRAVS